MSGRKYTVEDVLKLNRPTDGFLCPLAANTYGLEFQKFTITDYQTKKTIFEIGKDIPPPPDVFIDMDAMGDELGRKICYNFSEDVLRLDTIQTSLVFSVGKQEVKGFRMVERHYFRNELVKSFDFNFGFCIPNSTNTWDTVYHLPAMSESTITAMIDNPLDTKSDTFYFVDGELVMHNKASYKYFREDYSQGKRSYEDKYGSKAAKSGGGAKAQAKPTIGSLDTFQDMKIADAKDGTGSGPSSTRSRTDSKGGFSK